ncbi:DsbA family protein [Staphylococcus hominis]|uniref:DsbA family protein n=1 Tax=Staphylococcus hominis TaxID=1290 RepID=UPI00066B40CC|nr:thioredoxin domain-containing protein [Staphylococcus hominis]
MKKIYIGLIIFVILVILVIVLRPTDVKKNSKEVAFSKDIQTKYTNHSPKLGNSKKNTLVVFEDFKCPYCKKLHNNVIKKLDSNIEIRYINMAFLGKDSIKGSRASHAVNIYAPEKFSEFHDALMNQQPEKDETLWLTEKKIDNELDKLSLSKEKLKTIKDAYKSKDSKAWKYANKDKDISEKMHVSSAPTVYVNGHYIKEDSYSLKSFQKNISEYVND